MKSIQRLLVPTDLSENSQAGLAIRVLSGGGKQWGFNNLARRKRIGRLGDLYR